MGFHKIWIRINQFHLAMATPFRRPYVSWRVVSSIGELRGCTISGTRQHAGQAIAPIPRSSGDGPVEIQRPQISVFGFRFRFSPFRFPSLGPTCFQGQSACTYLGTRKGSYRLIRDGNSEIGERCISTGLSPLDLGIGAMA